MCYYETIEGEKKDSGPLYKAKAKFKYISKNLNTFIGNTIQCQSVA